MNRAERRRQQKRNNKIEKEKVYTLTQSQLNKMQLELYKKSYEDAYEDAYRNSYRKAYKSAIDTAFSLMLSIPIKILSTKHWNKSANKRIPIFIDDCVKLYDELCNNDVQYNDIINEIEQYIGNKIDITERIKKIKTK